MQPWWAMSVRMLGSCLCRQLTSSWNRTVWMRLKKFGLQLRSPTGHHSDTIGIRKQYVNCTQDMIFSKLTKHDHLHAIRKWLHCGVPICCVLCCRNRERQQYKCSVIMRCTYARGGAVPGGGTVRLGSVARITADLPGLLRLSWISAAASAVGDT